MTGRVHEIKSAEILQPGPAALTDGLRSLQRLIGDAARTMSDMRESQLRL